MGKSNKDNYLGMVFESKRSGKFEVIAYNHANDVTIRFIDTGYVKKSAVKEINKGWVKDPTVFNVKEGCIFGSLSYGKYEVIEYVNSSKIKVRFIDTGYETYSQIKEVRNGVIKDHSVEQLVFGFGVNNADYKVYEHVDGEQKVCPVYNEWCHILRRGSDLHENVPRHYENVKISESFKYFMDFRHWLLNVQPNKNWRDCVPDKDLLSGDVKLYSPETIVYVPVKINNFILSRANDRGEYMLGVSRDKRTNKYTASCSNPFTKASIGSYIGTFDTELEAHKAWQRRKHEYACALAELQDDHRVADALRQRYAPDKDWSKD